MSLEEIGGSGDALVRGVGEAARRWRLWAQDVDGLVALWRNQPRPGAAAAATAFEMRLVWRAYAMRVLAVRIVDHDRERTYDPEALVRISLEPLGPQVPRPRLALGQFQRELREVITWTRLWDFAAANASVESYIAETAGKPADEVDRVMFDAVMAGLECYPAYAAGRRIDHDPEWKARAAVEMAGWARMLASEAINSRMAEFLRREGAPKERVFGEVLPGAALEAWAERKRAWREERRLMPLARGRGNLLARVLAAVEVKDRREEQLGEERVALDVGLSEAERLEVQDLVARTLSKRERQAFDLRLEGASYAEIAAALKIKTGPVGTLLSRAKDKLRRAAA